MTEQELMAGLRLRGIDALDGVGEACIEADGHISVLLRDPRREQPEAGARM